MRIFLFSQSFYSGGAEKVAINLANYFVSKNYKVNIFVLINDGPLKKNLNRNIKIININKSLLKSFLLLFFRLRIEKGDIFIFGDRDISLLSLPIRIKAFIFAKNIRIIVREANLQDNAKIIKNIFKRKLYRIFIFFLMGLHNDIVANSKDTKDSLLKYTSAKEDRIRVIPNPVLDEVFFKQQKELIKDIVHRNNDLIFIGRFSPQKNISLLIDSLKLLEDKEIILKVLFLGEGDLRFVIEKFVKITKHEISIKPPTNKIEMYLKDSKVLVLPSIYEGFGNVIVESMFFGLTPVVTDCKGAPKEIIEYGRYGYLAKSLCKKDFARMIELAINRPKSKNLLKSRASQFSVEKIAKRYIN